ncbi:MAG: hypothetical protein ACOYMR_08790 [Ilumatobacteraceae bacterium]|jgi:hypothetical protein
MSGNLATRRAITSPCSEQDATFTAVVIGWLALGASVSMGGGYHSVGQTQLEPALHHVRALITELLTRR